MIGIMNLCFLFRRPPPLPLSLVSNYSLQFLEPCSGIFIIFFLPSVWNKFWKTQEINLRSSLPFSLHLRFHKLAYSFMCASHFLKWKSEVTQSCPTLCNPMDHSPPGSIHGIFQVRVLEWVAISFSRGSSQPRDQTQVSRIAGRCFTILATRESHH